MTDTRYPLGRRAVMDARDVRHPMRMLLDGDPTPIPERRSYRLGPRIDQASLTCPYHDACIRERPFAVGCAWRAWLAAEPVRMRTDLTPVRLYHEARSLDEWAGQDYAGTSVRAGVKALDRLGLVAEYHWAETADDVLRWLLLGRGTVVVGSDWHEGMFEPDEKGLLRPTGRVVGGHAYLLYRADRARGLIGVCNSWGAGWGRNGTALMEMATLDRLLRDGGEACAAVERATT